MTAPDPTFPVTSNPPGSSTGRRLATDTDLDHRVHGTPQRALVIWLFLIAATILAWAIGERGMGGPAIVALLFVLAFVKGSLVILDFMAVRHAPHLWRWVTLGWLGAVCALIGLAYWKGLNL